MFCLLLFSKTRRFILNDKIISHHHVFNITRLVFHCPFGYLFNPRINRSRQSVRLFLIFYSQNDVFRQSYMSAHFLFNSFFYAFFNQVTGVSRMNAAAGLAQTCLDGY